MVVMIMPSWLLEGSSFCFVKNYAHVKNQVVKL